eukprot:NODE_5783_length_488_cov_17.815490_g4331_i0.p3 GENE.NODE_5783_length_488_cov_17.815490_g4331_i0~~NODE_5783_length_488_cov_17.815490_g4331_i0.p3  ORF type:complete len:57 (+),score=4.14 NODE_5783_length_488_cov_17.815490_g4331_i0:317-487(+)
MTIHNMMPTYTSIMFLPLLLFLGHFVWVGPVEVAFKVHDVIPNDKVLMTPIMPPPL